MDVTTLAIAAGTFGAGWWIAARRSRSRFEDEQSLWRARVDAMKLELTLAEAKLRRALGGGSGSTAHFRFPSRSPRRGSRTG